MFRLGKTRRTKPKPQPARRKRRQKHSDGIRSRNAARNQVSKNKAADNVTDAPLSEVPSENPIQATPNDEAVETETFAHEAPAEPFYGYGFPDNDCPVEDGAEIRRPIGNTPPLPIPQAEGENKAEAGGIGGNNTPSAPPPEFSTENWAAIVRHFARKLGAAQMQTQPPRGRNTIPTPA